jgi:putative transcriptional regulator
MTNRIRELREAKGLSQGDLGLRIGLGKWDISRIENGKTQLKLETAKKVAAALDVSIAEVLDIDDDGGPPSGFAEDLAVYDARPGDPFAGLAADNRYLMTATSNVLDLARIDAGDVLVVDGSAAICKSPPPLAAVRVQYHPDPDRPEHAVTLLRQFVPPRLVITNCSSGNGRSLDLERDDAQILGVVVSVHRKLG